MNTKTARLIGLTYRCPNEWCGGTYTVEVLPGESLAEADALAPSECETCEAMA